ITANFIADQAGAERGTDDEPGGADRGGGVGAGERTMATGGGVVSEAGQRVWVSGQRLREAASLDAAGGRTAAGRRAGVEGGARGLAAAGTGSAAPRRTPWGAGCGGWGVEAWKRWGN